MSNSALNSNSKNMNKLKRSLGKISTSLRRKVIVSIFIPVILIYLFTISYQSIDGYSESLASAHEIADNRAYSVAAKVEEQMIRDMESCRSLARTMQRSVTMPRRQRLELCDNLIRYSREDNPQFLSVWYNWQLHTFREGWKQSYGRFRSTIALYGDHNITRVDSLDLYGEPQGLYKAVQQRCTETVTDPYYEDYEGSFDHEILEASLCVPLLDANNKFVGLVGVDVSLDSFQDMLVRLTEGDKGSHYMLFSPDGRIVASTRPEEKGMMVADLENPLFDNKEVFSTLKDGTSYNSVAEVDGEELYFVTAPIAVDNVGGHWGLAMMLDHGEIIQAARAGFFRYLGIGISGLLIIGFLFNRFIVNIVHPMGEITDYANELAAGDLSHVLVVDRTRKDEVGQMMIALDKMGSNMKVAIRELKESAALLGKTAGGINADVRNLAEQAMAQASSMQQISTSMQEISVASNSNHAYSESALAISSNASTRMEEGTATVDEASAAMLEVSKHLGVIREIANQTAILSLNANVEAARAGTSGKGFAVVATAIRDLAERCRTVSNTIEAITSRGNARAVAASESMNTIKPDIDKTAKLVKEITANSYSQTTAVNEISSAIASLNDNTQRTAASADKMAEYVHNLTIQSEKLGVIVDKFTL